LHAGFGGGCGVDFLEGPGRLSRTLWFWSDKGCKSIGTVSLASVPNLRMAINIRMPRFFPMPAGWQARETETSIFQTGCGRGTYQISHCEKFGFSGFCAKKRMNLEIKKSGAEFWPRTGSTDGLYREGR
jgi:hypothetical protein